MRKLEFNLEMFTLDEQATILYALGCYLGDTTEALDDYKMDTQGNITVFLNDVMIEKFHILDIDDFDTYVPWEIYNRIFPSL